MATSNFDMPNAAAILSGGWQMQTNFVAANGQGSRIDIVMSGTAATVFFFNGNWTVTVDGAPTAYNGLQGATTIFTGLSDAAHAVSIVSADTLGGRLERTVNPTFTVTGAAPAVSAPAGVPNQVILHTMGAAVVFGGKWTAWPDGGPAFGYDPNGPIYDTAWIDTSIRFRATCTDLYLFGLLNGWTYRVVTDGGAAVTASATVPNDAAYTFGWIHLASALDGTAEHEYSIQITAMNGTAALNGLPWAYALGAMTSGAQGTINTAYAFAAPKMLRVMGDSIAAAGGITPDSYVGWVSQLAQITGCKGIYNAGIAGDAVAQDNGSGLAMMNRSTDLTGGPTVSGSDIVIFQGGTNDYGVQGETPSQLQSGLQSALTNEIAILPGASFYLMGMLPRYKVDGSGPLDLTDWYAAERAAVTWVNANNASVRAGTTPPVQFIDMIQAGMTPGSNYSAYYQSGELHPNDAGAALIGPYLAGWIAAPPVALVTVAVLPPASTTVIALPSGTQPTHYASHTVTTQSSTIVTPDATPTYTVKHNGTTDGSVTPAVTGSAGVYSISYAPPSITPYATGDSCDLWTSFTVGGQAYSYCVERGTVMQSTNSIGSVGSVINPVTVTGGAITGNLPANTPVLNGQQANPIAVNYPYAQEFDFANIDATNWTQAVVTIKAHKSDPDSAALITVKVSSPASGSDGLILLNGAAPSGSTSSADGTLTVTTATTTALSVVLALTARGTDIAPAGSYFGEITLYKGAGKVPWLGWFSVAASQTVRANPSTS